MHPDSDAVTQASSARPVAKVFAIVDLCELICESLGLTSAALLACASPRGSPFLDVARRQAVRLVQHARVADLCRPARFTAPSEGDGHRLCPSHVGQMKPGVVVILQAASALGCNKGSEMFAKCLDECVAPLQQRLGTRNPVANILYQFSDACTRLPCYS